MNAAPTQTLESAAAGLVVGLSWSDVDEASLRALKTLVKDQLALQIGAMGLPWSRHVRAFMANPRPGKSSAAGEPRLMHAADAAYLNATYGHGFEYDDVAGNGHPGCCVVPTALAVGEEIGATLGEVAMAMLVGYETYVRIGKIASPELVNMGWHPHAVLANFGAAATSSRLKGLSAAECLHALAIALSHASGTTEYTSSGGSIKRVHAGIAARNGIEAVELARLGITGPSRFLSGPKGFLRSFVRRDASTDDALIFNIGAPLSVGKMWLKSYCCCGAHHPYIDAMAQVRGRTGNVVAVHTNIQSMTANLAGSQEVLERGVRTIEELQFGLTLQMALSALGHGNGYAIHRRWLDGRLPLTPESEILQFARRIRLHRSAELDQRYPRDFVADVQVEFDDGTMQHIFVDGAKGMARNPLTSGEHQQKLEELCRDSMSSERAKHLFDLVDRLESNAPVTELTALLRAA